MRDRAVVWGDLHSVWDLGGLPTASGPTRFGRIFRSPSPDRMDARGWEQLRADGVVTLIDLRNDDEVHGATSRPDSLIVVRRSVEDQLDRGFMNEWGDRLGSPAYYPEVVERWPGLVAGVFRALADAPRGGVLIHCGAGRDRTGMVTAMLFELVDAERASILADYETGVRADNAWLRSALPERREQPMSDSDLDRHIVVARAELTQFLDDLDVPSFLLAAGITPDELARVRIRLLSD